MELNKNDSLFTYIDSNDTQDLYTKYINKKIPKLSKYAEIYLANLEKEKIDEGENSNNSSKNNINLNNDNNDYNSSIKDFSNDITNNDSIINNNFQINKLKNEPFKNETIESNKSNTINYLAIEQLKKNIEIKTKKPIIISKVNNFTINYNDNKISDYKAKISEQISNHYKKMVPAMRNKIKSRLFFNFKLNKEKLNGRIKISNNIKSQRNLNINENILKENNIKSKSFFFSKINTNNNSHLNKNKKKVLVKDSPFANNIYSNYTKSNYTQKAKKKLISNSLTENSCCSNMTNNKHNSLTLNVYWVEKETKRRIKMLKLLEEKNQKETGQLREKPKINQNSRRIAERLSSNSNTSVFERLSESTNKILFNVRKKNLFSKNSKTFKKLNITENPRSNKKKFDESTKIFKYLPKNRDIKSDHRNSKVTKIIQCCKMNLKKVNEDKLDYKYTNNNEKTKNLINKNESFNKKMKFFNNKKLINFLNKNQSLGTLDIDEISERKKINKKKIKEDIYVKKSINTFTNDQKLMGRNQEYYKTEIYKINSSNNIEIKNKKQSVYRYHKEKNINKNKYNVKNKNNNKSVIKNNKVKNNINRNSFKRNINNTKKNYLNISSNQITEDSNKINRRKMDLLKLLNFSSNIGIKKLNNHS